MATPVEALFQQACVSPAITSHLSDARAATVLTTATAGQQEESMTALSQTFISNAQDARRVKIGTTTAITIGLRDNKGVVTQSAVEGRLGSSPEEELLSVTSGSSRKRDVAFVATVVGTGDNAINETLVAREHVEAVAGIVLHSAVE